MSEELSEFKRAQECRRETQQALLNMLWEYAKNQEWERVIEWGAHLLDKDKYEWDIETKDKIKKQIKRAQEMKGVAW